MRFNIFSGTVGPRDAACALENFFRPAVDAEAPIRAFEERFAGATGCRFAVSFGSGRMGLYAILEALGIGRGDEVLIPAYTCVVVPNAVLYRGATPVYADIDPVTFNLSPEAAAAAITPRTKALYLQHTFGNMADPEPFRRLAARHGLVVIEDGAHSLGGRFGDRTCGTLGDVAFFSTDHSKVINTLLGGVVTTGDEGLARRIRAIQRAAEHLAPRQIRRVMLATLAEYALFSPRLLWAGGILHKVLRRLGVLFFFNDELLTEKPSRYPYPCRLSAAQSGLGLLQMDGLAANLAHRRRLALWLESRIGWYAAMPAPWREGNAWLRYSFLVQDRREFVGRFRRRFDLGIWFDSVVQGRRHDLEKVGYRPGSCPAAERAARHVVNFPTHPRVDAEVLRRCWEENEAAVLESLLRIGQPTTPRTTDVTRSTSATVTSG